MDYNHMLEVEVTISAPKGFPLKQGEKSHLGIPTNCTYGELLMRVKEWAIGDFAVDVMLFREKWGGEQIQIIDDKSTKEAIESWRWPGNRKLFVIVYKDSPTSASAGPAAAAAAAADVPTGPAVAPAAIVDVPAGPAAAAATTSTTTTSTRSVSSASSGGDFNVPIFDSYHDSVSGQYSIVPGRDIGSLSPSSSHPPSRPQQQPPAQKNPPSQQKLPVYTQGKKVEVSRVVSCDPDPVKLWGTLMDNCDDGSLVLDMEDAVTGLDDAAKNEMIEITLKDDGVQAAYDALCKAWIHAIQERKKSTSSVQRNAHPRTAYDVQEPSPKKRSAYDGVMTDTPSSYVLGSVIYRVTNSPHTLKRGEDQEQVTVKWEVKNNGDKPWDASQLELRVTKGQNCVAGYSIPDGLERDRIGPLTVTLRTRTLIVGRHDFEWEIWDKRAMTTVLGGLQFTLEIREPKKEMTYSSPQPAHPYQPVNQSSSADAVVVAPRPPPYNTKQSVFTAQFVQDVTLKKDGVHNKFHLGKSRVKIWRVRNTGASQWPAGCSLVPMTDSVVRVKEVSVPRAKPNEEVDVFAVLEVPTTAFNAYGDLSVNWMMIDPSRDSMLAAPLNLDINIGIDTSSFGRTDRIIEATWEHARYRS